jgi:3-oxoacyl-[acyl-carrier protein] reductase
MDLTGQVAVVTGASRGIGRAIALRLAAAGADVVVTATSQAAADATSAEVGKLGRKTLAVKTDVSVAAEVEALFGTVTETFGKVDILVNNAGITKDGLLVRMKEDDWDSVLDVNLKGMFLCTREAAKLMTKARYGRIVNISSVVGESGNAGQANYAASKAGMIGFTKTVARELAKRNITVNAITPGFIETDMTSALSEKVRDGLLQQIPLERLGSAENVADAVCFLASGMADYITGHALAVNGGMHM